MCSEDSGSSIAKITSIPKSDDCFKKAYVISIRALFLSPEDKVVIGFFPFFNLLFEKYASIITFVM